MFKWFKRFGAELIWNNIQSFTCHVYKNFWSRYGELFFCLIGITRKDKLVITYFFLNIYLNLHGIREAFLCLFYFFRTIKYLNQELGKNEQISDEMENMEKQYIFSARTVKLHYQRTTNVYCLEVELDRCPVEIFRYLNP